jgi:predicted amidohydrolase
MRGAILQLCSNDHPAENTDILQAYIRQAVEQGAEFIFTPEVSNCVSLDRALQGDVIDYQVQDMQLLRLREDAKELGVWLMLGSWAVRGEGIGETRFANRCFVINPKGEIAASYDKIHMFDVDINAEESFRESKGYKPGSKAVTVDTPWGKLGLSICYDLRFPKLFQALAEAGARILTVPAAFSPVTGAAHWHTLLRARAIETGCFVIAPAQTGTHSARQGKARKTYGHSLVVAPWGEVLLDAGAEPGLYLFDLDLDLVEDARARVPSLANARPFDAP